MDYVRLGSTGLKVSRICLGMMSYGDPAWRAWVQGEDVADPIVRQAVEAGVTFFDTADMYSVGVSEEITGRLLGRYFTNRDSYVLATKVFWPMGHGPNDAGLSRKHVTAALDASLRRLGTDHVDLYQIHRFDPHTPVEETMEALHDAVRAGKVRYLGASSMYAWQFATMQHVAREHGWTPFVSMQNHYNLAYREEEREMLPFCRATGVGVVPWSPLARGLLTRPRPADAAAARGATVRAGSDAVADSMYTEADHAVVDAVEQVAAARGVPMAQVGLAWLLSRPGVTAPIVGATKERHLTDALGALEVRLTDDEVAALEAPYVPHPVLGH
ncbi:aldo/keto reductase [Kineosporia sp. A_224]|uniref:aldo/keto reductase n=1 Tax=Kineosporia sp. A_224 TaxID=1962180 RepID=UPI000B4AB7B1|nr:aldo/keto reductase [Kineosporia sp. A_224]